MFSEGLEVSKPEPSRMKFQREFSKISKHIFMNMETSHLTFEKEYCFQISKYECNNGNTFEI